MLALDASLIGTESGEHARAGIPSAKLDVLFEHLDDLIAEGHRALVFSQFTSFLSKVGERLEERGIPPFAWLDGSTRRGRATPRSPDSDRARHPCSASASKPAGSGST